MKTIFKFLLILTCSISFGQNQTLTGVISFTSSPKFLNLSYSGTNTKFLTINAFNQLQWSSLQAITAVDPTFQKVLNAGRTSTATGPSFIHFTLEGGGVSTSFASGLLSCASTLSGGNYTVGPNGFYNTNNDGRFADLSYVNGLRVKTNTGLGQVTLKTTNVTNTVDLESPNNSGTLITDAPTNGNDYVRSNGSWKNLNVSGLTELSLGSQNLSIDGILKLWDSANAGYASLSYADDFYFTDSTNKQILRSNSSGISIGDPFAIGKMVVLDVSNFTSVIGGATQLSFTQKDGKIPVVNTVAPSNSSDAGKLGEIRIVGSFIYWYTGTQWLRSSGSTF
jgi:hypothetical protein